MIPVFILAIFPCRGVGWSNFAQLPPEVCRIACSSRSLTAGLFIISPFQWARPLSWHEAARSRHRKCLFCYLKLSSSVSRLKTATFKGNIILFNSFCIFNMYISVHRPFVFTLCFQLCLNSTLLKVAQLECHVCCGGWSPGPTVFCPGACRWRKHTSGWDSREEKETKGCACPAGRTGFFTFLRPLNAPLARSTLVRP